MKRNLNRLIALFFMVGVPLLFSAWNQQESAKSLFEKALHLEETKGELELAIDIYKQVVDKFPGERAFAAKAQLQIGICYEKLGYEEAVKAYEMVLQNYAEQSEQVATAKARMEALQEKTDEGISQTKIEGPKEEFFEYHSISSDGTKIAGVVFSGGQNIAVYDLVTNRIEKVTNYDWVNVTYYPVWSPDGKKVAYQQYGLPGSASLEDSIVLMVSTIDGKSDPIFSTKKGNPVPYDWLMDSSAVVVSLMEGEDISLGIVLLASKTFKSLHTLDGTFHSGEYSAFADASPDGRYIVFADGSARDAQNIYCVSTDGQSVEVLTDHVANDIQPRWAPDGNSIIFISFRSGSRALWGLPVKNGKTAGEPYIIKEIGQGTNLLNWIPSGLACLNRIDMWDVYMAPVDAVSGEPEGKLEHLDYSPSGGNRGLVWSPDGKHMAFFSAEKGGQPGQGNLVIMPAAEGQALEYPIPMENFHLPQMLGLRWMADSTGLSFYGAGKKGPTLFRFMLASEKWETLQVPTPGWTRIEWNSSGDAFYYTKNGLNSGIFEYNPVSGADQNIYEAQKGLVGVFRGLRISRDFKKIASSMTEAKYENNKLEERGTNIVVVELASGQAETINIDSYHTFALSPDGQKMVVLTYGEDKPKEMFVFPLPGGIPAKFEFSGGPIDGDRYISDWSPDGQHMALDIRQNSYELFVMKNVISTEQR